ncbi:MarR family transcriptional regulator [Paraglaciecola sp.]|uniref:MarR family winged helix-turn-helix transcriptional regulator n=1 Tax=Paraglaciecola sp. TaxID=1920173 RepID=UPI003265B5D5
MKPIKNTDVLVPILLAEKIDKISGSIRHQLEIEFKVYELNVEQGLILEELNYHREHTTTQKELGRKLRLARYSASRNIDNLESLGYVKRFKDPDSARRVKVSLTRSGDKLASILSSLIRNVYKDIFSNLDGKEQTNLFKIMTKL